MDIINYAGIKKVKEDLNDHKESYEALNIGSRLTTLEADKIKRYTVNFAGSLSAGVRADDAVGMVTEVGVDDQIVRNDFDNVPFFNRSICCGYHDANGKFVVNAYRGEPDFAWDGSNGELFYEETPFYYKGDLINFVSVCGSPIDGYELSPRFKDGLEKEYSPVFWMSVVGGKATSRSGTKPTYSSINTGVSNARTYHSKGHTETIAARISDYILQMVEFATKDPQTIMMGAVNLPYNGADHQALVAETGVNRIVLTNTIANQFVVGQCIVIGTTRNGGEIADRVKITAIEEYDAASKAVYFGGTAKDIAVGNYISSRVWDNGATDIVAASSGSPVSNTNGKYPCIWRGKVDPWGNGYSAICDMFVERTGAGTVEDPYVYTPWYLPDPTKYAAGAITADYVKLNYKLATSDGYAKTLGMDSRYKHARLTDAVGAGSTTWIADYYYYPRYAISAVFVGGDFGNGRHAGPLYFNLHYAPSNSHINRLARLFVSR